MGTRAIITIESLAQERLQLAMILISLAFFATNMFPPVSRASTNVQIGDSATAKGVDPATYSPINRTQSFTVRDTSVYSWLKLVDVTSPSHNLTWLWLTPQRHQYRSLSLSIPDPGPGKVWPAYYAWSYLDVNGGTAAQLTGIWEIDVFLDGVRALVQTFSINDNTPPSQPMEGYSWPSYNIKVNIQYAPSYARQDVINAMKQWNFSQTWFQKTYGLASRPTYNLIVSNSTSDPIQVFFNQTQTTDDWGCTSSSYWHNSTGYFTGVTSSISIILSLKDGSKLNDAAIEDVALHELGHALGLGHVQRAGDLMNHLSGNLYDLHSPTTLNLYALYQLSSLNRINTIPSLYELPSSIQYDTSPPFNSTQPTATSTTTQTDTLASTITQVVTEPTTTTVTAPLPSTNTVTQTTETVTTVSCTTTQTITTIATVSVTRVVSEGNQIPQQLFWAYLVVSLSIILALSGLLIKGHRGKSVNAAPVTSVDRSIDPADTFPSPFDQENLGFASLLIRGQVNLSHLVVFKSPKVGFSTPTPKFTALTSIGLSPFSCVT